jgi:hypothetical protein
MTHLSGFTFSRIVIIQSLEPDEVETGTILSKFIAGQLTDTAFHNTPVEIIKCSHARQFLEILTQLTRDAATGNIPLLHVECHGHPVYGLEFENSSTLNWEGVSAALLPLNIATNFNLLAVFSACFAGFFISQMGAITQAPCWCLVAPTKEVSVDETMSGFRTFYSVLFRDNNMGPATEALSRCHLSEGRWLSEPAERWFETLVIGYVETHCNKLAGRLRAKQMFRQFKKEGKHHSIGALQRMLRDRNNKNLLEKYFETYFITDQLPENLRRFENTRNRVKAKLSDLRSTGEYFI